MKNILITGGSSGIGLAIARQLANEGGWNIVSISRSPDKVKSAIARYPVLKDSVEFINGNVGSPDECGPIAKYLFDKYKVLHGLVNNAGMLTSGGIHDINYETWRSNLQVNLDAPYVLTQQLLPMLKAAQQASVINISSIASETPGRSIAYSVSKAGLDMLTKFLAGELGPFKIRVNGISPGLVETSLHLDSKVITSEANYREMLLKSSEKYPIGRIGQPEDIAHLASFLLSEKSLWITGVIVKIDGGTSVFNEILPKKK
ncbi:MAG TPA: SDR family oxidoreductase [Bacteroidales bacterium]|nr:SDR family oxidoreductase [Bacteroidales bacterium]